MEGISPNPLARYKALQAVSILLIAVGLVAVLAALSVDAAMLSGVIEEDDERFVPLLALALGGGLALVVGLVMNAARAVVVRETLPESRYRGPSVVVLVLLATVASGVASISLGSELIALQDSGEPSVIGSLLLLSMTQLGLVATAALWIVVPRALAGAPLLPERGLLRSVLIGAGLGIPAWIGAQTLGVVVVWLLSTLDIRPEPGLVDAALERAEPWVLVVTVVGVAPVVEELFFRWVAYNAWEREYGARRATIGSALLFAVIHGSLFALVPIFALGVLLGVVYRRTRSLPAVIALHAVFNAVTVTLALLLRFEVIQLPPLPT